MLCYAPRADQGDLLTYDRKQLPLARLALTQGCIHHTLIKLKHDGMKFRFQAKQSLRVIIWVAIVAMLPFGCGQGAAIGEACEIAGSKDECVEEAICTNESNNSVVCRQFCEEQEDCPVGSNCNGISETSQKSCQPD